MHIEVNFLQRRKYLSGVYRVKICVHVSVETLYNSGGTVYRCSITEIAQKHHWRHQKFGAPNVTDCYKSELNVSSYTEYKTMKRAAFVFQEIAAYFIQHASLAEVLKQTYHNCFIHLF